MAHLKGTVRRKTQWWKRNKYIVSILNYKNTLKAMSYCG